MTGEDCRSARRRVGWSALDLAQAAGLAFATVRDFESGLRAPRPGSLIAIRKALRASPSAHAPDADLAGGRP